MKRPIIDPFLPAMCVALVAAWKWPGAGAADGPIHAGFLTQLSIAAIFLVQGLSLQGEHLRHGLSVIRVHLLTQATIFLIFPILTIGLLHFFPGSLPTGCRTGIIFLAVLPTTISTAVVYTDKAGGNPATALFNVTLANFLGILIVPIAMTTLQEGATLEASAFIKTILLLLVLPFTMGQILRARGMNWMDRHKDLARNLCQGFILFILWAAFCNSFAGNIFQGQEPGFLISLCVHLLVLLLAMRILIPAISNVLKIARQDRPAFFFCGSEKPLAAGLPMGTALFGAENPQLGMILLPVLAYHPMQLLLDGILASHWGSWQKTKS